MSDRSAWPKIIKDVGFDFDWDEEKVWKLDLPSEEMPLSELSWHFDIPFLWENGQVYNLTPREVLDHPGLHPKEHQRAMNVDMSFPIDIMENKGRWLILDGLHRLMKAETEKRHTVMVRKVPREKIRDILS